MTMSPASRGRGLKHIEVKDINPRPVARFTRAWIETYEAEIMRRCLDRRPLHAGVD